MTQEEEEEKGEEGRVEGRRGKWGKGRGGGAEGKTNLGDCVDCSVGRGACLLAQGPEFDRQSVPGVKRGPNLKSAFHMHPPQTHTSKKIRGG